MTLFDRVFSGNDAVYGLTETAIDNAIAQYGADQAVAFPPGRSKDPDDQGKKTE